MKKVMSDDEQFKRPTVFQDFFLLGKDNRSLFLKIKSTNPLAIDSYLN